MRREFLWCALCALLLAGRVTAQEDFLHHRIHASILVADPVEAAEELTAWAEQVDGYFLVSSSEQVVLRLPGEQREALRGKLQHVAEQVVEVDPEAVDLRESYLGIQSAIRSRKEILQRNLSFIDRADVEGTLAIEKEVSQLLREIEELEGRLRKLNTDRAYAWARIDMSFQEQSLPQDIPSSFQWINTVDFYRFLREAAP